MIRAEANSELIMANLKQKLEKNGLLCKLNSKIILLGAVYINIFKLAVVSEILNILFGKSGMIHISNL